MAPGLLTNRLPRPKKTGTFTLSRRSLFREKRRACEFKIPINIEELIQTYQADRFGRHSKQRGQLYFSPFLPQPGLQRHQRPNPEAGNVVHVSTVDNDFRPAVIQMILNHSVELIGRGAIETST